VLKVCMQIEMPPASSVFKFRRVFTLHDSKESNIKWFPRHMYGSFERMKARVHRMDAVVEVHDCRIPSSGRNNLLANLGLAFKPHVLVMNKKDMLSEEQCFSVNKTLLNRCENLKHILWTNCKNQSTNVKAFLQLKEILIRELQAQTRLGSIHKDYYTIMVVGIPNVGKSSLINSIRSISLGKQKSMRVAPQPGVTKHVEERILINEVPPIYLIDTPGVLPPRVQDLESGMKLALCYCVPPSVIPGGMLDIADYLLYWMNKNGFSEEYVRRFNLRCPYDKIFPALADIAESCRLVRFESGGVEKPDIYAAASQFVDVFRSGQLGQYVLDEDYDCSQKRPWRV